MNLTEIGQRIKLRRIHLKLTQEALSEMMDVSPHYIYEIERGTKQMSLNVLEKLATSLNMSTDYILFGRQPKCTIPADHLDTLLETISAKNRDTIEKILFLLIPRLK